MNGFRYKHGDKPLGGYTIQRAAGRGGFGEVYYAVSDAGREVALKVILGGAQVEMRGVSQCMNLKSPHLVTIFDVKYNADGVPFIIMEYVSGPTLRQLLDESPAGLSTQKAAFFLREIAKGLSYLHDCGIVHRDLKPGNVFYENGAVKIGDYGLSKAITQSQHSAQTITVGTVHYMAPEIGMGRYDRSIDIYALGAVLYEMLTGQVPYLGASPAEVLMKHISCEPDLGSIEEPFASVIRKCMAKDPAQRYQTVQEVVEALFGAEHVRNSVSVFRPESLSLIAGRVAQRIQMGGGSGTPMPPAPTPTPAMAPPQDSWQPTEPVTPRPNRVKELLPGPAPRRADPRLVTRYIWTGIICLAAPLFAGFVAYANEQSVRGSEEGAVIGVCIGLAALTLLGLLQLMGLSRKPFAGWWRAVYRPLGVWACIQMFLIAAFYLGNASNNYNDRARGGELVLVWFLIFFPIVLIPVLLTLRFNAPVEEPRTVRRARAEVDEALAKALHGVKGED